MFPKASTSSPFRHKCEGQRMKCYSIMTYHHELHDTAFYILVEDDTALLHALEVIKSSMDVTYFTVDGTRDGSEFYDEVFYRVYPGLRLSTQTANKEENNES